MVKTKQNLPHQKKNRRMHRWVGFILIYILLLASCDRNTLMHTYQPVKGNCWDRTDTLTFNLPDLTTDDNCSVLVGLRVTNSFPYEMLIMEVEQNYQNPMGHRVDTIRYHLAEESGDFTENGINYFQYETQGLPLDLKKGQTGEIKIRHLMHREILPGIMDVGIHVIR